MTAHPEASPEEAGLFLLWELVLPEREMGRYAEEAAERLRRLAPVVRNGGWWESPELEDAREAYETLKQFAPSRVWLDVRAPGS